MRLEESLAGLAASTDGLVDLDPETFASQVTGQTVVGVERRGKWIVLRFGGGGALLIHLRMSGQLILDSYVCPDDPHTRVRLLLDDGRRLYFSDTRKFGRLWLVNDQERVLADLGPHHRSALVLRYLDGLTVPEVADHLGRTVHATEALLVRARRAFRTLYEQGDDTAENHEPQTPEGRQP